MSEVYHGMSCDACIITEGSALPLGELTFLEPRVQQCYHRQKEWGCWEKGGGKGRSMLRGDKGRRQKMRSFLRKGAITRPVRIRVWPRTDPGCHLACQGKF